MSRVIMTKTKKLGKTLYKTKIRRALLVIITIAVVATSTACSGEDTIPLGESVSDDAHALQIISASLFDKIGEATPPEEHGYLVIEFQIENTRGQQDASRDWSQQFQVENTTRKKCGLVNLSGLEGQLWNTTLSAQQIKSGRIAFTTPEKSYEFKLTFQFPISKTNAIYKFRANDKRIEMYVDHVLEKIEQIERTKGIPVIGGILESLSRSSIRYLNEVLVPEDDISNMLEQLKDLNEEERRTMITDYLREYKNWD